MMCSNHPSPTIVFAASNLGLPYTTQTRHPHKKIIKTLCNNSPKQCLLDKPLAIYVYTCLCCCHKTCEKNYSLCHPLCAHFPRKTQYPRTTAGNTKKTTTTTTSTTTTTTLMLNAHNLLARTLWALNMSFFFLYKAFLLPRIYYTSSAPPPIPLCRGGLPPFAQSTSLRRTH